jgi:hypothetical protein
MNTIFLITHERGAMQQTRKLEDTFNKRLNNHPFFYTRHIDMFSFETSKNKGASF